MFLLRVALPANLLNLFMSYATEEGGLLQKMHPGTYAVVAVAVLPQAQERHLHDITGFLEVVHHTSDHVQERLGFPCNQFFERRLFAAGHRRQELAIIELGPAGTARNQGTNQSHVVSPDQVAPARSV